MLRPQKEVHGLLPGSEARPADILLPAFKGGRDYAIDVTVTTPFKEPQKAAAKVLGAAESAARKKYTDIGGEEVLAGVPFKFQPIAFEALGGMDEPAQYLIDTIAKRVRDHSTDGAVRAAAKLSMTRTISCILARWAAELILHRLELKEYHSWES